MILTKPENNAFEAIRVLLKYSNVKVTNSSLKKKLLQHFEFPTLTALSDVLNEFRIDNLAIFLNPQKLKDIPLPAIAHFENGMGYVTITKIEGDVIEWFHDQNGIIKENIDSFSQKWRGVTLLIQANENSGEISYNQNKINEVVDILRFPSVILFFVLSSFFFVYKVSIYNSAQDNKELYFLILTKFLGSIISFMLVWSYIDSNNSIIRRVCTLNNRTNCNNILSSNASKVFSWLSWAEVGFFYFIGGFLILLIDSNKMGFLRLLNFLAIPYTIWSIYYQWKIAKSWCILCLAIQILLWLEFYITNNISTQLIPNEKFNLFIFFIVPFFWVFMKQPLINIHRIDSLENNFQKIKFDPNYIKTILSNERILPPIFDGMKVLELGNFNAQHILIMTTNPTCISCADSFNKIIDFIKNNSDFKCKIIFRVSNSENSIEMRVVNTILNLPPEKMLNATFLWFKDIKQNFNHWNQKLNIGNSEINSTQINFHTRWLELCSIISHPTIFINNVEYPKIYEINELEKFCKIINNDGIAIQK